MKIRKSRFFICFILATLITLNFLLIHPIQAIQPGDGIALFVLDNSGSMAEVLKGKIKLNTAKKVIEEVVNYPSLNSVNMGLIELGGHCEVQEIVKPGLNNRQELTSTIDRVQSKPYLDASTPISEALYEASETIRRHRLLFGEVPARIILISDGEANCMAEEELPIRPCDMIARLKNQNILFDLTLINYGIATKKDEELECITKLSDNSVRLNPNNIANISTIIENDINDSINKGKKNSKPPEPHPQSKPPNKPENSFPNLAQIGQFLVGLAALIVAIWRIIAYFLNNDDSPNSSRNDYYY